MPIPCFPRDGPPDESAAQRGLDEGFASDPRRDAALADVVGTGSRCPGTVPVAIVQLLARTALMLSSFVIARALAPLTAPRPIRRR